MHLKFLKIFLEGDIGTQEYPENSEVVVDCSSFVDNYKLAWQICINGHIYNLCSRFRDQTTCSGTADKFSGRINYVNAGTIKVTNMKRDEDGVLQCYKSAPTQNTNNLQKIWIIGN